MFTTPKTKEVVSNGKTVLSLGVGAIASDGVVALIPAEQKTMGKFIITGGSLLGAASIKGKSTFAQLFQMGLLGMGVMQGISLLRENIPATMKQTGTGHVAKAVNGALGLGCACTNGLGQYQKYPALMYPETIERVDFNREFLPGQNREYADFEEVSGPLM